MGWNDRDYNPGREEIRGYMANPLAMLQYALPIWRSAGLSITLTFWFLLSALFIVIGDMWMRTPWWIPLDLGVLLATVLWHEMGHRVFSRMVGGNHWEWVLWPIGGMVPPSVPKSPWPTFVGNVGGIVFNLALMGMMIGAMAFLGSVVGVERTGLVTVHGGLAATGMDIFNRAAGGFITTSIGIILFNLFPCFWFDGGYIWQSILWPKLGQWKATRVVCMAGMILAVPLFMLSMVAFSLLGMLMFAMIFADCYKRRQMLAQAGPGVMDEDDGPSYNYMDTDKPRSRKKSLRKKLFGSSLRKKARAEQAEQAKIDAILAKVKEKGLHSLSWWEKRTLKKATERQRQQDLAERL